MNIGAISYSLGGVAFILLSILRLVSWKGGYKGGLLVVAVIVNVIWNFVHVYDSIYYAIPEQALVTLDILKCITWILFLLELLNNNETKIISLPHKKVLYLVCFASLAASLVIYYYDNASYATGNSSSIVLYIVLVLSLTGLVLVEQLYRNTTKEQLWALKYMFFALAGLFVFDIFLYSNNILFKEMSSEAWESRGVVYALMVPLLAISAARNPGWSLGVHVSRNVVFYTASMLSVGLYLLVIAVSGYYIKIYGGGWGTFAQVLFVSLTGIVLSILIFSGHVRARVKQFVGTNFYSYKYDYRDEWLRLMRILSEFNDDDMLLQQRVIKAAAQIVQSPAGGLWTKGENNIYSPTANWNMAIPDNALVREDEDMIQYLYKLQSIINIYELKNNSGTHEKIEFPVWIEDINKAWLVVPVFFGGQLYGFILLLQSIGLIEQTWEDSELLFTVGQQIASYLVQYETATKLAESRQFDAFNRLSAYIVHDLKNVVAQLDLVVSNWNKHKSNPDFVEDAICTVDSAVAKMNRMLAQLRKSRFTDESASKLSVNTLLSNVLSLRSNELPIPILENSNEELFIDANKEKMTSVIGHLVQNAQEATDNNGKIIIRLEENQGMVTITIEDSGEGMDKEFILNRLFKPFDTTKGNAGMGIGVYESREYIQKLGGVILVESEKHKGTKMILKIPATNTN